MKFFEPDSVYFCGNIKISELTAKSQNRLFLQKF